MDRDWWRLASAAIAAMLIAFVASVSRVRADDGAWLDNWQLFLQEIGEGRMQLQELNERTFLVDLNESGLLFTSTTAPQNVKDALKKSFIDPIDALKPDRAKALTECQAVLDASQKAATEAWMAHVAKDFATRDAKEGEAIDAFAAAGFWYWAGDQAVDEQEVLCATGFEFLKIALGQP